MLVDWLLFPLALLAVSVGCGLTVERLAGWRLPGALMPSLGLALMIVAASVTTSHTPTAPLTTPLIIVLALVGYASSWQRVRAMRPDRWIVAVGVGLFAVCAAPAVLSASAGFLGYFVLNDGVFHFALINQLLAHGRDLSGVAPSAWSGILHAYLSTDYPTGADVALGAVRPLVGEDVAWLFTPYLAVIMALGAVAVYQLLDGVVRARPLRAFAAFVAGQAGLLYAFYLQGSVKELSTTWIITVTVALVFATLREHLTVRSVIPLAIAGFAGLYVLNLAIAPWLAPPLAAFAVVALWRCWRRIRATPARRLAATGAAAAAILAVVAQPLIASANTFVSVATGVLTQSADLGNLFSELPKWEMLGIWPVGDFRAPISAHYRVTYVLIGVELASAALGTLWALRRRKLAPLLLLAGNGVAVLYLFSRGSPYANAKVMMIFSLTIVLTAMLGAAALYDYGRRIEACLLAVAIAAGVLWTNALGYHDASVAPRDRFDELAAIGDRFSGQGPAFYNLADEYAIYFLRKVAPTDPGLGPVPARPGYAPTEGRAPWDPDNLDPAYLQQFGLLVLARSPRFSRPPADYRLAYEGRYFDVWQRTAAPRVLAHVALGGPLYPVAVPSCGLVMATAARAARQNAKLAYVAGSPFPTLAPALVSHPPNWGLVGGDPYALFPRDQPGAVVGTIKVQQPGTYQVWVEGAFSQRMPISIGGRHVGSVAYQLGPPGQTVNVGRVTLTAGSHQVEILRPDNNLTPGDGGVWRLVGPLMLVPDATAPAVSEIDPGQARSLCGRSLDWLEIVR